MLKKHNTKPREYGLDKQISTLNLDNNYSAEDSVFRLKLCIKN